LVQEKPKLTIMSTTPHFTRPTFDQALKTWTDLLRERQLSTDLVWIFDENLCFERATSGPAGFKLGFQTAFTPPPAGAEKIAYREFISTQARVVFYRVGSCGGKSVCLLLCDSWFELRGQPEGFIRRDEWLMSFRPAGPHEIEEITDQQRWENRLVRERPLHDLDFGMTLRAVHETLAHGRVLTPSEHFALRLLNAWRRLLRREP
jgi:hypothetical protein